MYAFPPLFKASFFSGVIAVTRPPKNSGISFLLTLKPNSLAPLFERLSRHVVLQRVTKDRARTLCVHPAHDFSWRSQIAPSFALPLSYRYQNWAVHALLLRQYMLKHHHCTPSLRSSSSRSSFPSTVPCYTCGYLFETNTYSTDTQNFCTSLPKMSPDALNYDAAGCSRGRVVAVYVLTFFFPQCQSLTLIRTQ